jgi:CRP-like cAMP-binding protein
LAAQGLAVERLEIVQVNALMTSPPILTTKAGNRLLARLSIPKDEYDILGVSLSRIRLAAGASVFDGAIDRVLFIEKGIAGESVLTSDGEPLGISIIGREGAVGLRGMGCGAYGFQVSALTAIEALQISARALDLACSKNKELESLLRNYSDLLVQDMIVTLTCHYYHSIDKRLPRWLLMAASRLGSKRLPFSQEVLAEAHGVTPTAINRVIGALESKGAVEHARKEIIILSHRKLRSKACSCISAIDQEKKYIVESRDFYASPCPSK